jgi:PAS domain S-box-containing protein
MPFREFPFIQTSSDLFCIATMDGYFIEISPSWSLTLGWSEKELKAKPYTFFVHPDDVQKTESEKELNLDKNMNTPNFENRYLHKDGHYVWLSWNSLIDPEKKLVYATAKDITILRKNAFILEHIENGSKIGYWEIDLSTNQLYWSKRTHQIHGTDYLTYQPKLNDGLNFFPQESLDILDPAVSALIENGEPYNLELKFININKEPLWIRAQATAYKVQGHVKNVYGTFEDITEEKMQKENQEVLFKRLILILRSIKIGIWEWDIVKNVLIWDKSMYELYGVNENDFKGAYNAWEETLHPEDRQRCAKELQDAIISDSTPFDTTFRIFNKDKELRFIGVKAYVTRNEKGEGIRVSGINWDVTEAAIRKNKIDEQQRILKLEKEKFETIVNNIPIMLSFYNQKGEFEWVNKAWENILGWSHEMMKDRDMLKEFYPDEKIRKEVLSFMSQHHDGSREFKTRIKDGSSRYTKWANVQLSNGYKIGIGEDIHQFKQQEEIIEDQKAKMITSSKLSSLGEMAAGIAHEINNPLAIILGQASLLKNKINLGQMDHKEINEKIDKIELTSKRIVKIINGLRSFSRNAESDPFIPVSLKSVFENVFELCREKFKNNNVKLTLEGDTELFIRARQTQIEQVFSNLLNNSYDAVVSSTNAWINIKIVVNKGFAEVSFTDSGPGIPKEIQEKMMQPFFTTKQVGKGTGLGLSISKGIIQDHHGELSYVSDSKNTQFLIKLPICED